MIIVSQTRDVIVNFERINFIKIEADQNDYDIEINYGDDNWDVIGSYDSFEEAKEILMKIVARFAQYNAIRSRANGTEGTFIPPKIFKLPSRKEQDE